MNAFRSFAAWVTARAVLFWLARSKTAGVDEPWSVKAAAIQVLDSAQRQSNPDEEKPNWREQLLMWGGLHPLRFSAGVVLLSILVSLPAIPASRADWIVLIFPDLPSDYTHAAFFGTVWAVQATLVALVYPIVLTFVPILLQRRASARFSLMVYMHDSGVVPAGSSSLLLLAWMTLEYLASPYIGDRFFLFAAVSNGLWFLANLWLTAQFLVKTIKYVRGEFGEAAYRRLAVHYALRQDLLIALCKHIYEKHVLQHGKYSLYSGVPIVTHISLRSGEADVVRRLAKIHLVDDVNMAGVNWAARRWLVRALDAQSKPSNKEGRREQPALQLLPNIGATCAESVDIVRVSFGPKLTFVEKSVFLHAFRFCRPSRPVLDGNTGELLEELASEVQSQLEQGNFSKAKAEFDKLRELHSAFLLRASSSSAAAAEGTELGQLRAGWSWNSGSLNESWMDVYRSLMRAAVSCIDADMTIWKSLVYLPSNLVSRGEVRSPAAVRELLQQFVLLDHFLSVWWRRRIHQSRTPAQAEGAWLPQPEREDYDDAIVTLIGALTNFGGARLNDLSGPDKSQWKERCRVAVILLDQLEVSATLLYTAVERGDAAAARWHCDNVLHWLSDRMYEFERASYDFYEADPLALQFDILTLPPEELSARLNDKKGPNIEVEPKALLWLALKRHWEAMRLICSALTLELGVQEGSPKLATAIASRLLSAQYFQKGLSDDGNAFTDLDDVLLRYIDLCCLDRPVRGRIHGFVDQLRRGHGVDARISGWVYTGSRLASHPEALSSKISAMLLALDSSGEMRFHRTVGRLKLIGDIDALREVGQLLDSLIGALESVQFRQTFEHAAVLRATWSPSSKVPLRPHRLRNGLRAIRQLVSSRVNEMLTTLVVSSTQVDAFVARLSRATLAIGEGRPRSRAIRVRAGAVDKDIEAAGFSLELDKEQLTAPPRRELPDSYVKNIAKGIVNDAERRGFISLLSKNSVEPVEGSDDKELLVALTQACAALAEAGGEPVILAPHGMRGGIAYPYHWGWGGRPEAPQGIKFETKAHVDGALSTHEVNGYPVIHMGTPNDDFFVIQRDWLRSLVFDGDAVSGVLESEFHLVEPQHVRVIVRWRAEFQGPPTEA